MLVRAYQTGDDAKVTQLLGLDATSARPHRIVLAQEGDTVKGAAIWQGEPGGVAQLGDVALTDANRRDVFYSLIRGVALAMIGEGFTRGTFTLRDPALLARIERDFRVATKVTGREPSNDGSGLPLTWEITVDLEDAINQLEAALARLAQGRSS